MLSVLFDLAAAASLPPALQPKGSWTVAYEQTMCLASRKFGETDEVELLLRPAPLGDNLEITFIRRGADDRRRVWDGGARLSIDPSEVGRDVIYKAWWSASQGGRVIVINTSQALLDSLSDETRLTFSGKKERALSLQTRNLAKLKPVIADCRRKVAQHWGVSPESMDRIATPAQPAQDVARWVSPLDYPEDALRKAQSGLVTVLLKIGTSGKVESCEPIESSGIASLERASCRAFERRASFKPAMDRAGQPIASWVMHRVWWMTSRG